MPKEGWRAVSPSLAAVGCMIQTGDERKLRGLQCHGTYSGLVSSEGHTRKCCPEGRANLNLGQINGFCVSHH